LRYKILVLADFYTNSANTIIDHATSFGSYSKHNCFYFNPVACNKPKWLNMDYFDIIVIHYSVYILGDYYLNQSWRDAISFSNAINIQFIQDEYRTIDDFHKRMNELNIKILFTCVPEKEIEKVYPVQKLPGVIKVNNLTGYVPVYLSKEKPDFEKERTIDIGYRAREIPWWLGEFGQEKKIIAEKMNGYLENSDLNYNISSKEVDRIYGKSWVKFLNSCRCSLGSESGASVFDFTGEIEMKVKEYCAKNPEATFKKVQELFFKDLENKIYLNQISPRAFECIGCGSCLVLFEGEYSGILKSGVHFIELKKDFSNVDKVIEQIKDKEFVKNMAKKAYQDIIVSGDYSYKKFVAFFDNIIDKHIANIKKDACSKKKEKQFISNKNIYYKQWIINLKRIHPHFIFHFIKLFLQQFKMCFKK